MTEPMPKVSHLKPVLERSGKPLDQPDDDATRKTAPTQEDLKSLREQLQAKANWDAFDLRGAGTLNLMRLAMDQGQRVDVTAADMAHFRAVMALANLWVAGDPKAEVPSGFGEPVRVEMAQQLKDALATVLASVQPPAEGQSDGGDK